MFPRCLAALLLIACLTEARAQVATSGPFWPGPGVSGSWYDAARNGEGLIVQYLPTGRALAVWFTYPPAGAPGEQAWLITDLGRVEGSKLVFDRVFQPQGARFGEAFDPAAVQNTAWGTLEIEFASCQAATLRYTGPAAFGSGTRNLTRLTTVDQLDCGGNKSLTASGARALAGLKGVSGAWYVPARSGEGWMIEELPQSRALVYWFTFTPGGQQAWTIGTGTVTTTAQGKRIDIAGNLITRGTRFGAGFNAADVQSQDWGTLTLEFAACDRATVRYAGTLTGYGSANREAVLLTGLAGAHCVEGTPAPRTTGTWQESAASPLIPVSEHAVAVWENRLYTLGGFGNPASFQRYDPATNAWTSLPTMPAARDHLAAFAVDGGIYFTGGASQGGSETPAWRFDLATARWDPRPELLPSFGSHAVVLNGRVYIGNANATLQEYDPAQRAVRVLSRAQPQRNRDHSQVVAFLGEVWMIAGRTPETTTVSIYDPVSERWRAGPSIQRPRGGFAAAAVGDQIVIGGGEVLSGQLRVEGTTEVYTAGQEGWRLGPDLPVVVHGTVGAAINGRFYIFSGSPIAATANNNTGRLHSILLTP